MWIAQGGEVQHTWWNRWQGGWSSELGFVRPVTNDSRFFFDEVKTSDPVDGNVKITLWRDGMYSVRGRMRGSGFDPYEFEVQAAVIAQDPSLGGQVALPHNKHHLVHMGEQAFENPTTDTNPGWEVPGQVFMHELTHVWDAHWSGPGWMATAIFADRNPSPPSPDSDWRRLGVEEKATIVHNWYGRYHENLLDQAALDNRYFHYIRDNIRVPNN